MAYIWSHFLQFFVHLLVVVIFIILMFGFDLLFQSHLLHQCRWQIAKFLFVIHLQVKSFPFFKHLLHFLILTSASLYLLVNWCQTFFLCLLIIAESLSSFLVIMQIFYSSICFNSQLGAEFLFSRSFSNSCPIGFTPILPVYLLDCHSYLCIFFFVSLKKSYLETSEQVSRS